MRSKIASALATNTVRYSSVWEDLHILEQALEIGPDDDILSITSAGCNVLGLLLREPRSITALDLNCAQTHLLELKIAGIRSLRYEDFVVLVGARPGDALGAYERIRGDLSRDARLFWDASSSALERGMLGCGKLEGYFRDFLTHLHRVHDPSVVATLVAMEGGPDQRSFFAERFATRELEELFRWYYGREMMQQQGRDPAQFRYVEEGDVGGYFWKRFSYACSEIPLRDNFYLELFLTGRLRDLERGPHYLRRSNFERLRSLVDRIVLVTDEIERCVTSAAHGRYSKLNLSNLFEYMSDADADALFAALADRVRPGGRIAYWNLLVPRSSPEALRPRLRPRTELAHALWLRDRSWFYRAFHLEEVLP